MKIGLMGLKGSGKSTVAAHLTRKYNFRCLGFADPIRLAMWAIGISFSTEEKDQPHPLLCGKTPRYAMQTLGTEWGRRLIGEDLWVNLWLASAVRYTKHVTADDVRFEIEVRAIKNLGGKIWIIKRPGIIQESHISESGWDENWADEEIVNNSDIPALLAKVDKLMAAR